MIDMKSTHVATEPQTEIGQRCRIGATGETNQGRALGETKPVFDPVEELF